MSITSCFLVFLLCLSLHACTARRLGAVYTDNKHENKLHFSTKNDHDTQKVEDDDQVKLKAIESNEGVVSVSWGVPHRKHGEKVPGFNLDYAPPKTHPPSHN